MSTKKDREYLAFMKLLITVESVLEHPDMQDGDDEEDSAAKLAMAVKKARTSLVELLIAAEFALPNPGLQHSDALRLMTDIKNLKFILGEQS